MPKLKPYPKYKPTNIQWLGNVPEHWEVCRLKYCVSQFISGGTPSTDNPTYWSDDSSGTPWVAIGDMTRSYHLRDTVKRITPSGLSSKKLTIIPAGTLLYSMYASLGKVALLQIDAVVNQAILGIIADHRRAQRDFLRYWLEFMQLHVVMLSSSSTQDNLNAEKVRGMTVCLPPLAEQRAIARYLNHITSRIDTYTSNKRKLVELLKEYRQALIHQTVTRGLNPNVKLKPSGIQWLGDIPQHWEVRRLRDVADMRVSNVDKHVREDEIPVRLCNYVDVYKNDYIDDTMAFMSATATPTEIERFRLERHDVLITKDSETWDDIGVPSLVTQPAPDLVSGYHLALLRSRADKIKGDYLFRALQSTSLAYQFHIEAKGVTRYGLSQHGIKSVYLPLPPLPEQRAIADYLDRKTAKIDTAIDLAQREIELLEEYRTRLIADIVTEQLDVRDQNIPATPA